MDVRHKSQSSYMNKTGATLSSSSFHLVFCNLFHIVCETYLICIYECFSLSFGVIYGNLETRMLTNLKQR